MNDNNLSCLSRRCASKPLVGITKAAQRFIAIVQRNVSRRSSTFQLLQGNVHPLHSLESLKSDAVMLQEPAPYPLRADAMLTKLRVCYTGFNIAPDKRKRLLNE